MRQTLPRVVAWWLFAVWWEYSGLNTLVWPGSKLRWSKPRTGRCTWNPWRWWNAQTACSETDQLEVQSVCQSSHGRLASLASVDLCSSWFSLNWPSVPVLFRWNSSEDLDEILKKEAVAPAWRLSQGVDGRIRSRRQGGGAHRANLIVGIAWYIRVPAGLDSFRHFVTGAHAWHWGYSDYNCRWQCG